MSAPKHRAPRSRARIAAAAGALPLVAAALVAPTMTANAAPPKSLAIYDAPGWANDTVTRPLTGCTTMTIEYTKADGSAVNKTVTTPAGRRTAFFDSYPGSDKTSTTVKCTDGTTDSYTYSLETKQGFQVLTAAQEPRLDDKPGSGSDTITLTALPGVYWTVKQASTTNEYHLSWFGTDKTKAVSVTSGTQVTVEATAEAGYSMFKPPAPAATGWQFTPSALQAQIPISAASAPKWVDEEGKTKDAVIVTAVPNIQWTVKAGSGTAKLVDFGKNKTATVYLKDLATMAAGSTVTVTATGSDAALYAVDGTSTWTKNFDGYVPADVSTPSTSAYQSDGLTGTTGRSVTITSPSNGLVWTVDGVTVKTVKDRAVKVPVTVPATGRNVAITAKIADSDNYVWATGASDLTTSIALTGNVDIPAPVVSWPGTGQVKITGDDRITFSVAGTPVVVPTSVTKIFTLPNATVGTQIVVVAKPKAGYNISGAAPDGSKTFVGP